MTKIVHVAVGVIKREDKIFLTKRLAASHKAVNGNFPVVK